MKYPSQLFTCLYTELQKKLIKIQLSIITFPLPQVLAQLGVGFAQLALGTEAFAKAAGSSAACQRTEPPADLFYLLHIQAVCSPKQVFVGYQESVDTLCVS